MGSGGVGVGGGHGMAMESYSKFNFGTAKLSPPELRLNGDLEDAGEMTASCFVGDKRSDGIRQGENAECPPGRPELGDKQLGLIESGCVILGERVAPVWKGDFCVGDMT